jgi:hypothetical protein
MFSRSSCARGVGVVHAHGALGARDALAGRNVACAASLADVSEALGRLPDHLDLVFETFFG